MIHINSISTNIEKHKPHEGSHNTLRFLYFANGSLSVVFQPLRHFPHPESLRIRMLNFSHSAVWLHCSPSLSLGMLTYCHFTWIPVPVAISFGNCFMLTRGDVLNEWSVMLSAVFALLKGNEIYIYDETNWTLTQDLSTFYVYHLYTSLKIL